MIDIQISGVFRVFTEDFHGSAVLLQLGTSVTGAVHVANEEDFKEASPTSARLVGLNMEVRARLEPPFSGPERVLKGVYAVRNPITEEIGPAKDLLGVLDVAMSVLHFEMEGRQFFLHEWIPFDDVAKNPLWADFFKTQLSLSNPWQMLVNHERLQSPLKRLFGKSPFDRNVFVMMRFRNTAESSALRETIRTSLHDAGLVAHFADELSLADELWDNVCTYMCGCRFGVAVVEEIEERSFNPNVAIEIGFMQALQRKVLVLKDRRVPMLPTDLAGRLYREFDSYNLEPTVKEAIGGWVDELRTFGELPMENIVKLAQFDVASPPNYEK
jgi:hypothetical protein